MHWFLDPITKHYADFSGRASRKEYWMFTLCTVGIYLLLVLLVGVMDEMIGLALIAVLLIALALPGIALQARRLHDIGWSGWWILLSFIPYVGGLILIVLYCLPSQVGTNKYGAHPYGVAVGDTGVVPPQQSAEQQNQTAPATTDNNPS